MAYLVPVELPTQAGSKLLQKLWSFERAADVAVGVRTNSLPLFFFSLSTFF
jgi:hypothetical protein